MMPIDSPLIVNLAPTGMVPTRAMSSLVPLQPLDVVADVLRCAAIGITMVHLHARDSSGAPTSDREIYARMIGGIREHRPDLVIGVSCSGRNFPEFERRAEVLRLEGDLKPDFASLTPASLNFVQAASVNEPDVIRRLLELMLENDIRPEFEIFDLGMANYADYLIKKLGMRGPFYANIMLGNIATAQADFLSIGAIRAALPAMTIWGLGGIGREQIGVTGIAAAAAPAVRIGLEDDLWSDRKRTRLASNVGMVERMRSLAAMNDRTVMSSAEFRQAMGLS